jgi:recombination protein RecT
MSSIIQDQAKAMQAQASAPKPVSVGGIINALLDGEGMRKRFDTLLGARSAQFVSSIISLCNENKDLQACVREDPMSVIGAALKAATYDLPIDPSLGFAYIIPSRNTVKTEQGNIKRWQARMQIGWKGIEQLCIRSGQYVRLPHAVDVREGELVSYDRLTSDVVFNWIEDEDEREKRPVIGYAAYFRLKNGAEASIYMSKSQIEAHERKYRHGEYMSKGWRDDWEAMARKTVLLKLVRSMGVMSIDYRDGGNAIRALEDIAREDETPVGKDADMVIEGEATDADSSTAENLVENA